MTVYTLLIILIVLAAIMMVGIVLIQESKGGGLASNFSSYNQIGGVRKTTDFIEKATWALAAFMVIASVACAWVAPKSNAGSTIIDQVESPITSPSNANGLGASPVQDEAAESATPAPESAPADNQQ